MELQSEKSRLCSIALSAFSCGLKLVARGSMGKSHAEDLLYEINSDLPLQMERGEMQD